MANKVLHLDFSKDPIMPPIIYGRIGDEKMQTVTVKISRRDEIPDLTGGIIRFEGEPAGGNVKVFDSDNVHSTSIGLQKGTFEYTFPSAVFSVEGNYQRAYFSFEKDGKRDTTGDFKIIVKKNADITNPEAETIITEYNRLVQKLEEAYQKALTKVGADYDDIVIRIEGIKTQISLLLTQINKIVTDAEGRISGVEKTVTDSLNNALKELHAANFYTKDDTDKKFQMKDAQPLPEGVTSFDQLSDFSGQTFYLTAAQAVSMSDYDSLPLEFQRNFSFYVENKSAITGHYRLQIVQPVTLIQAIPAIRMVGKGIGSNPFMRLLTKEDLDYSNLVNNALVAKKELIVAQDWNTIKEPGMYAVNGATGLNRPAGAFVGNLLVQQAGGMNSLAQFFIGNEQLNTRRYTGSTWLAWQTVALEPQQTPLWTG
ncbi:TPA: BppU family phage baseplate upper protein, partial [Enterococcus faecalis]